MGKNESSARKATFGGFQPHVSPQGRPRPFQKAAPSVHAQQQPSEISNMSE